MPTFYYKYNINFDIRKLKSTDNTTTLKHAQFVSFIYSFQHLQVVTH